MDHSGDMQRCLRDLDVVGVRRLWREVSPYLPQPASDEEAVIALHHARTQSPFLRLKERAWSHRWLVDHGYPSGLPDELRPRAERMYPRIVDAVGISVRSRYPEIKVGVARAMSDAVAECYVDKRTDVAFVRARMMEARERQKKYFAGLLSGER